MQCQHEGCDRVTETFTRRYCREHNQHVYAIRRWRAARKAAAANGLPVNHKHCKQCGKAFRFRSGRQQRCDSCLALNREGTRGQNYWYVPQGMTREDLVQIVKGHEIKWRTYTRRRASGWSHEEALKPLLRDPVPAAVVWRPSQEQSKVNQLLRAWR